MKKIKVLQMFIANARGGRTQYILNNWIFIDKEKFQFDFVTLDPSLDFAEEVKKSGGMIHYLSCYAEDNKERFIEEINKILDNQYDIIHIHSSFWRSFTVEECVRQKGKGKIVIHAHNFGIGGAADEKTSIKLTKQHCMLKERLELGSADSFLACSKEAAEWMYGDKVPTEKVRILRNGIDLQKFSFSSEIRNRVRSRMGLEKAFVIGNVGRFVYQKNHNFLIEVFQKLSQKVPEAVLLLIGAGELESEMRKKIVDDGLEKKVYFLGKRNDVAELLQAMDAFLLPSRFDGFPLALLEAQAVGVPCIAGNVPQNSILSPESTILKFNSDLWIDRIQSIRMNKKRISIPQSVLSLYDIRNQVRELEKIYSDLILEEET